MVSLAFSQQAPTDQSVDGVEDGEVGVIIRAHPVWARRGEIVFCLAIALGCGLLARAEEY